MFPMISHKLTEPRWIFIISDKWVKLLTASPESEPSQPVRSFINKYTCRTNYKFLTHSPSIIYFENVTAFSADILKIFYALHHSAFEDMSAFNATTIVKNTTLSFEMVRLHCSALIHILTPLLVFVTFNCFGWCAI